MVAISVPSISGASDNEIKREAILNGGIDLDGAMTPDHWRSLTDALTKPNKERMRLAESAVNAIFTKYLFDKLPVDIQQFCKKYPNLVVMSEGFMYSTITLTDKQYRLWVNPKVPAYFNEGEEVRILSRREIHIIKKTDCRVEEYYKNMQECTDKYVAVASVMYDKDMVTFYNLLVKYPTWFEALYKTINNKYLIEPKNGSFK